MDIPFDLEHRAALLEQTREGVEPGLLDFAVDLRVSEESHLHILGFGVLDQARCGLRGAYPRHAAEDGVLGEQGPEGFFVADAILDNDEGRFGVDAGLE